MCDGDTFSRMSSSARRLRTARRLRVLLLVFSSLLLRCRNPKRQVLTRTHAAHKQDSGSRALRKHAPHQGHCLHCMFAVPTRRELRSSFLAVPRCCCSSGCCAISEEPLRGGCSEAAAKGFACLRFTALPERTFSEGVSAALPPLDGVLLPRSAAAGAPLLAAPGRAGVHAWLPATPPSSLHHAALHVWSSGPRRLVLLRGGLCPA